MDVLFLSPAYPPEMQQYTRGLSETGARVWGVGDSPRAGLPPDLRRHLVDYLEVPRILDEDDVISRVSGWLRGRDIQRVLTNWEVLIVLAARLRERWAVPGMSVDTAMGFRDKQLMKERVAAAGLRVAKSQRVRTVREVWEAAERIGYPLVLKPIAGAGSSDTHRVEDTAEMERALARMGAVPEASCEEYIAGAEFTFDTVCVGGQPAFENIASYMPKPLECKLHEWISPVVITVRDMTQPRFAPAIELGRKVLSALRMGDGFTHMEWFLTASGEPIFGEIGCRPGGACLVDQMNYTIDADLFREWARVVCFHRFEASTERKHNVGVIFKRAKGHGRITSIQGLDEFMRRNGKWVVEDKLLRPGNARRNWQQTLISDGYLILRHPDWDEARRMADEAATEVVLYAE